MLLWYCYGIVIVLYFSLSVLSFLTPRPDIYTVFCCILQPEIDESVSPAKTEDIETPISATIPQVTVSNE